MTESELLSLMSAILYAHNEDGKVEGAVEKAKEILKAVEGDEED